MKNNKTYELTGALMNLYKKLNKIEKHCSDAEKVRIYSGIAAVMPDEIYEIKRVQNPYSINPAVNNTIQASSNYMMSVNAAEKEIDEMNTIAELFKFMRKKNNLPVDIDVPMFMIGELKSAFESHDFELFEKLVMASNDDPYGFNYINNLVLSKMNESNDNTNGYDYATWYPPEGWYPPKGQSSEACDQEDNASIIEQLDDVFNDVEPIEPTIPEECITKDEKKSAEEVSEEPEELVDPNIVMAYPRDPEQINNIMNYLNAGFEVNGESITLIRKINKKYKTNITLNTLAVLNQSYLDNTKFSANINIKNTTYTGNVFRMDNVNDDGTIDGPLPTAPNLSEEVLRYICDNLQGTRLCTKHGLVSCVKYEFGIEDINTWEVGAISYVMLNILGNKYITKDGNLDPAIKEYRKFFNIPKSEVAEVESSTVKSKSRRRKKKEVEDNLQAK